MNVSVNRNRLLDGLKRVQEASNAKSALPILGNVKVEAKGGAMELTATDLDLTVITEVDCTVNVEGSTTIPLKRLTAFVASLSEGDVKIETVSNDSVRISSGNAKVQFSTFASSEFPELPEDGDGRAFIVSGKAFADLMRKTAYAKSNDDTRRTLKGILVEFRKGEICCVATDGRRLAVAKAVADIGEGDDSIVIPPRAIPALQKFAASTERIDFKIVKSQLRASADGGKNKIYSRLLDEKYPNYRNVIPTCDNGLVVDKEAFLASIARVTSVSSGLDEQRINIVAEDGRMVVVCENDLFKMRDEIPVKYNGEQVTVWLNPLYLADSLRAKDDDAVKVRFTNGSSPFLFDSEDGNEFSVLMPLRIG